MARDYRISGECLVLVKGMGALITLDPFQPADKAKRWELGLARGPVTITPSFKHADIKVDDFGPDVPADVMVNLADCIIDMTLVHYDHDVLNACIAESLGGAANFAEGVMVGAGVLLGGMNPPLTTGCHFISLNLTSPVLGMPWHFPTTYLHERPLVLPLGTKRTFADVRWRAIPYFSSTSKTQEVASVNTVLFDHILDAA